MERKIRVGAVSYLNAKPLIYGLQQGAMDDKIILKIDHPASIAAMLMNNEVDIALAPVVIIPGLPQSHIVSDYCIGCDGAVASVCMFSDVPLEKIETILMDYQSRTSVALLKILIRNHWKINPVIEITNIEFQHKISGVTAGLVIGDRAFEQRTQSKYVYDLGTAWKEFTGLPFVFAAWISNKRLDAAFIKKFNETNASGLNAIPEIVSSINYQKYDLLTYYQSNISYSLDKDKIKALKHFLKLTTEQQIG